MDKYVIRRQVERTGREEQSEGRQGVALKGNILLAGLLSSSV